MEGLNKFYEIKTVILEIFGKIFGQTRETVEYKYTDPTQNELWNNISLLYFSQNYNSSLGKRRNTLSCLLLNLG